MVKSMIVAFLACTSILLVSHANAQPPPESLLRLKPSANLRVETTSHQKIEGRFLRVTGDTLFLSARGEEPAVPLREMQGLWQRGRATKTGAIIVGAIVGTGFCVVVAGGGLNPDTRTHDSPVAAFVIGAASGALVGALIGAAIPKWHRRYP
jgi:hypothetical protein